MLRSGNKGKSTGNAGDVGKNILSGKLYERYHNQSSGLKLKQEVDL